MDTKEALKSFELDARLFYDAIAFSTDDYLYIIDMQRDIALVSDNMRDDFDLPDSLVPGLIPLWRELIVERDRKRFDDSIDSMLSGETGRKYLGDVPRTPEARRERPADDVRRRGHLSGAQG